MEPETTPGRRNIATDSTTGPKNKKRNRQDEFGYRGQTKFALYGCFWKWPWDMPNPQVRGQLPVWKGVETLLFSLRLLIFFRPIPSGNHQGIINLPQPRTGNPLSFTISFSKVNPPYSRCTCLQLQFAPEIFYSPGTPKDWGQRDDPPATKGANVTKVTTCYESHRRLAEYCISLCGSMINWICPKQWGIYGTPKWSANKRNMTISYKTVGWGPFFSDKPIYTYYDVDRSVHC